MKKNKQPAHIGYRMCMYVKRREDPRVWLCQQSSAITNDTHIHDQEQIREDNTIVCVIFPFRIVDKSHVIELVWSLGLISWLHNGKTNNDVKKRWPYNKERRKTKKISNQFCVCVILSFRSVCKENASSIYSAIYKIIIGIAHHKKKFLCLRPFGVLCVVFSSLGVPWVSLGAACSFRYLLIEMSSLRLFFDFSFLLLLIAVLWVEQNFYQ